MKLSTVWKHYESDRQVRGYSRYTLESYQIQLNLLIRHFGDVSIDTLTIHDLKSYLAKDMGVLKASTIAHRAKFIRAIFRWSHEEGIIDSNPSLRLVDPKLGKRIPKSITLEHVEMLRSSCAMPMERALIEIFYSTGCRVGEIQPLNRDDIDFNESTIRVIGKGDKERDVYFNTMCRIWLKKYLSERKDDDEALFVTERAPRRMSKDQMRYVFKRIAKRSGVDVNIYPHRMRHTFATHLLDNGAPLDFVQNMLGHERIDTTRIYAYMSGKRRKEEYKRYFRA